MKIKNGDVLLINNTEKYLIFILSSNPSKKILLGSIVEFDLNNDEIYDLLVKYLDFDTISKKARIMVKGVSRSYSSKVVPPKEDAKDTITKMLQRSLLEEELFKRSYFRDVVLIILICFSTIILLFIIKKVIRVKKLKRLN